MFKKIAALSSSILLVVSISSYAINPSPSDESAMNAMKYKADVLGIKLGMSAAEAKVIIQSSMPKFKFVEYLDKATNQPAGWAATPESCAVPHSVMCDETIDVRHAGGKIWFVSRVKTYDRKKSRDIPTLQVAQQSLSEKYGVLVKIADYNKGLYASHTFFNTGGKDPYGRGVIGCGGSSTGGIPTSFSSTINWYYSISASANYDDPTFLGSLNVALVDCQHVYEILNNKAISDAALEKQNREKDVAKGVKPKL